MQPVIMPKLGLTMEEGTIIRWMKNEGDTIEKGEILIEVETDKAVNEVESTDSGTLGKIYFDDGKTVEVLTVIGYILDPGEEAPDEWPEPMIPREEKEPKKTVEAQPVPVQATPIAKKLAAERGVDLDNVSGTGKNGTITKEDVLRYAEREQVTEVHPAHKIIASPRAKKFAREKGIPLEGIQGTGPGGRITEQDVISFIETQELITPSRIQQITAKRLTESFTTVPHFYLRIEVDASELVQWRERLLPTIENAIGVRLTYTDMLVQLVARTLEKHPKLNASWEGGFIRLIEEINLGIAAATDEGLVVPVIKDTNRKGLAQIAEERKRLAEKAQSGKLGLSDLEGGTFTLTNLGMFGIDDFDAIINPPQSAVLAVGRIAERPYVESSKVVVKPTIRLSLSMDHRVLDGAVAARFLDDLRGWIETPEEILKDALK